MREPVILKILKPNKTRSKIWRYIVKNPDATIRQIQKAVKASSPSVVHFHLKKLKHYL